jgi:hypothetical protein
MAGFSTVIWLASTLAQAEPIPVSTAHLGKKIQLPPSAIDTGSDPEFTHLRQYLDPEGIYPQSYSVTADGRLARLGMLSMTEPQPCTTAEKEHTKAYGPPKLHPAGAKFWVRKDKITFMLVPMVFEGNQGCKLDYVYCPLVRAFPFLCE